MQILNMRKVKNPEFKTRAFFDLETKNFYIHDCRLVMGNKDRLVVMMPFKMVKNRFHSVIEIKDVDYLEAVGEKAVRIFEEIK